jgi:hypothetical protein
MIKDPIIEEVWRVKDEMAASAGYDFNTFFDRVMRHQKARLKSGPAPTRAQNPRKPRAACPIGRATRP